MPTAINIPVSQQSSGGAGVPIFTSDPPNPQEVGSWVVNGELRFWDNITMTIKPVDDTKETEPWTNSTW
jgi:hypothetical protein